MWTAPTTSEWDVGYVDCYEGEQTEYGLDKPQDHGVDEQLLCSGKVSWLQYIAVVMAFLIVSQMKGQYNGKPYSIFVFLVL